MRAALSLVSLCLLLSTARADVPPPNACNTPGEACDTAGPEYKARGVCQAQRCSRALPGPNGTIEKHEYDCNLCVVPPAEPAKTAASTAPPAANKASACAVGGGAGGIATLLLAAGFLAVTRRRA